MKTCYVIAGPNGAGKTTFANSFLPEEAKCLKFINADLIAKGLEPFKPEQAAIKAGKLMIKEINNAIDKGESFAFETTLSGKSYKSKILKMKKLSYRINLYYFKLSNVDISINRVHNRVMQGGHNIPVKDIVRRFEKSYFNFQYIYKPLADAWMLVDTSGLVPIVLEKFGEI